ncbi:hypothetical protein BC827DRAFT_1340824 [Russula dissimulans]|nr:hypothetical protein BC827DRAFT_1340824 [Russula dissimulans]
MLRNTTCSAHVTVTTRSFFLDLDDDDDGEGPKKEKDHMSHSIHAVKRFRLRELQILPPPTTRSQLRKFPPPTTRAALSPALDGSTGTSTSTGTLSVVAKNPFVPHKNPQSGRWAPPKYSLRRQAELIKHARASGTLHLLPPGPKMSQAQQQQQSLATKTKASALLAEEAAATVTEGKDAAWTRPVEWVGTVRERNIAGADVGNRLYAGKKRMFKGHKWERTRERRVARTKMLLRDMDKRVERFKAVRFFLLACLELLFSHASYIFAD